MKQKFLSRLLVFAMSVSLLTGLSGPVAAETVSGTEHANLDFEDGITGWDTTGTVTEENTGAQGGEKYMHLEANSSITMTIKDLKQGSYTLSAYVKGEAGKDEAYLKLYDGHDWKWFPVRLLHTDMEYLRKNWYGEKASAPTLEKKHRKYFLRFSYTKEVTLTKTPVKNQVVCSVDLGINTDAVCTIMRPDGTVLGRKFINFPSEKDRMYRTLGRIRKFQREHGPAQAGGRWAYTKRLNTELGRKIAGAVAAYAEENHADVIVFEYLEMQGKISGKNKQKLHLWRKREIQKRCGHQAHRKGIRVSRVCAWNTSRLAYDGSGQVLRDPKNHRLCTFQTGKRYNCDLSASYNIGARYFIRELLKPLPATERSLLEAKVPSVKRRTSCVYADLKELHLQMEILKAA